MITFYSPQSDADFREAGALIRSYESWLGMDLSFQNFEAEMKKLHVMYGPPRGAMILARDKARLVGCVGLRDLGQGFCEMKRMFVLPEYQGQGIGSMLLDRFIKVAGRLGYRSVRLDSVQRLKKARRLYQKAGFKEIEAYCSNPDPEAVYMQLDITE